jgi:alpha-1,3-rhamnosyl/mannosyltransferase
MKLVFAVDAIHPPLTGVGRYAWELASRFISHPQLDAIRFYLDGRWVADPVVLLQEQQASRLGWLARQITSPGWYRDRELGRLCRDHVFHSPNFFLPAGVNRGVITIHDLSVFKFPETHPAARHAQYDRELERSLESAQHLIAVSEAIRVEIIEHFSWPANSVTAVPHGVSPDFAPRPDHALTPVLAAYRLHPRAYALCVSTLEPRKNIDRLLQAYRDLPAALRGQYRLVLAGSTGWLSQSLQLAIKSAEREGWLLYLGYVPDVNLPALYAGARTFVYPSLYEGFGLPLLEAMACGTPAVTSNTSAIPETAGGAALLVDPQDIDAVRQAIERALLDDEWRAQARAKGLEVARQHTWERCAMQTLEVYKKVDPAIR